VRARQASGGLTCDLDPATVLIVLFGATLAPVVTPQLVEGATWGPADSDAFVEPYVAHLRSVVAHPAPR